MAEHAPYDALIVGSGPNGLAAAITLLKAGHSVKIFEAKPTIGGGLRTSELTLPGFKHDICSAIHPMGAGSPFFRSLPLEKHGLEWIQPDIPLAHPLDDGQAAVLHKSLDDTARGLDIDHDAWHKLMQPLVPKWKDLTDDILGPLSTPQHPMLMARFGLKAMQSARYLATHHFKGDKAQALFAGLAAHSIMPLDHSLTSAIGLVLGIMGHSVGWPFPRGGSEQIAAAMASYIRSMGGVIETRHPIKSLDDLPTARAILLDITPRQLLDIGGDKLPASYRRKLENYRYGPGVFKLDLALDEPVPWKSEACRRAGTVHVGGSLDQIAQSEQDMWEGRHSDQPYVLVAQQSLFDTQRAPEGKHTVWAYCHVPHGSRRDMTEAIHQQIERFAPGFRELVLEQHAMNTADFQEYNPNYIGGDINGGVQDIRQLFTRPTARLVPYSTPVKGLYLCSSSTPPGGGVHGMCGYHAAKAVLNEIF